jgi:hypothetical protein
MFFWIYFGVTLVVLTIFSICCDWILTPIIKIASILAFVTAFFTLYHSYIKPADIFLKVSRSAITIYFDKLFNNAPVIDLWCSFCNDGAKEGIVDNVQVELIRNGDVGVYDGILFFKMFQDDKVHMEAHAHPIIINKYSETTKLIGFKGNSSGRFETGKYTLKANAYKGKTLLSSDQVEFELDDDQVLLLQKGQSSQPNQGLEVLLK